MTGYTYLSHLRLGSAALFDVADAAESAAQVATTVETSVNGAAISVPVRFFGPADVAGLSPDVILHRSPAAGSVGAETNYFPHVELREADLPWRYTPAAASPAGRIRAWLALIVVEVTEQTDIRTVAGAKLPMISVPLDELPEPADLDLWAHVQVALPEGPPPASVANYVRDNPAAAIARLVAPRRMEPDRRYIACLVPTFEVGRRIGLGEPLDLDDPDQMTLAPAWNAGGPDPVRLPVYDHWRFSTGAGSDFESLARELKPHVIDPAAAAPGFEVDPLLSPAPEEMVVEGALKPAGATPSAPVPAAIAAKLTERINRAADLVDAGAPQQVGSPLYGRWPAARRRIGEAGTPAWLEGLNTDPRWRIAAAAGGDVVQRRQEGLMARAWAQVGQLDQANTALRGAQAARGVGDRLRAKHLDTMPEDVLLQVAGPMLARLPSSGETPTVLEEVAGSAVPEAGFEGAFRRMVRPRGPHMRRFGVNTVEGGTGLMFRQGWVRRDIQSWFAVDQGAYQGPSQWSTTTIDRVRQTSNIWGYNDASGLSFPGTMYIANVGWPRDVRFTLKFRSLDDDSLGCVFRYKNASNYYRLQYNQQLGFKRLVRCRNGAFTTLWEVTGVAGFVQDSWHDIEVTVEGDRIRIRDGQFGALKDLCEVTDNHHSYGQVGLYTCGNDNTTFDDIRVEVQQGIDSASLPNYRTDSGTISSPSNWLADGGGFLQTSNIYGGSYTRDALPKPGTYLRIGSNTWQDYEVTVTFAPGDDDSLGLIFRWTSQNDFYRFEINRQFSYRRLVVCAGGQFRLLWQHDRGYDTGGMTFRLVLDGARMRGYDGQSKLFELRDRTHPAGRTGPYCCASTNAAFPKFEVRSVGRRGIMRRLNDNAFQGDFTVPPLNALALGQIKSDVMAAVDPHATIRDKVTDRVATPAVRTSFDPLEPERPALDFPEPLAIDLAAAAPELLLPGVGGVPDNAVVLLSTNTAFVASFLVGANHEMARELTWRGLPADLRATPFRQFWDTRDSGMVAKDILPISDWSPTSPLSEMTASTRPRAVFLIRSELIRRFPDMALYLVQAVTSGSGRRPGQTVEPPLFAGRLGEDMVYVGFRPTPAEVIGTTDGLGWYLALEERAGAMRFGMDLDGPETLGSWSDLAWTHFPETSYANTADLGPAPPADPRQWGRNAAHMAAITYQQPVRLFVHADRLVSEAS